jgi:hypothetical protein
MYADESMSSHRFTVKEAAKRLNTSEAAIRQRIQRDSIAHEKDEDTGRVYIILDGTEERLDGVDTDTEHSSERELIDTLQEQLKLERESSAELRRIIAALTTRIPELPPSNAESEPRESDLSASDDTGNGATPSDRQYQEKHSSSWWRRFFGFE